MPPPPLPPLLLLTLLPLPSPSSLLPPPSPPGPSPLPSPPRRSHLRHSGGGGASSSSSLGAGFPRDSPAAPHHDVRAGSPPPADSPELCHGYYDVMGHYDAAFNCSTGAFRFCCGTCSLRFCCEHRGRRLEQRRCTNARSPPWARTAPPAPSAPGPGDPRPGDPRGVAALAAGGAGGVPYVVCGVLSVALAVAVGARAAWGRGNRGGGHREPGGDRSRALVDALRHQAGGGGARPERRSSCGGVLGAPPPPDSGPPRPPKNLYGPESGYAHLGFGTPEHRGATLDWRVPPPAPLSCSRSFHNLSHPPPPYESPPRADGARWASLRRLADRDLEDFGGPWGPPWAAPPLPHPRGTLPLPPPRGRRVLSQEFLGGGGAWGGAGGGTLPRNRPRNRPPLSHAASQSSLGGGGGGAMGGPGGGAPFSPPPQGGGGAGPPPRRAVFGGVAGAGPRRQSTAELQLLPQGGPPPGPPPAPPPGPPHRLRTGSRTEVTV